MDINFVNENGKGGITMKPILRNRTGKECKKSDCDHYDKRTPFGYDSRLNYCMECKWAYLSQYHKKDDLK